MNQGGYAGSPPEFEQPSQGGQAVPQGESPGTPNTAASGGAVDPTKLAETIARMNSGREQTDGSA